MVLFPSLGPDSSVGICVPRFQGYLDIRVWGGSEVKIRPSSLPE